MIGVIKEITEENTPAKNGRPEIKKKVVTVDFLNGKSLAIQFTGELRRLIIRGFKVNDNVDVEYIEKVRKGKQGNLFNNVKATSIKRI